MIVEDNPNNMKLAVFLLESAGHEVFQATDGPDAIALVRSVQPDLVLMDVQLAGMDGLSATKTLKADPSTSHIRIFALTAFAMKGDEERVRTVGCDGYIQKPIRHREFLQVIKEALT